MSASREDFSVRRCIDFTEAVSHDAQRMGMTTQDCLFVFAEMTAAIVIRKGLNIEQVLKTFKDIHNEFARSHGRIE